MRCIYCQDTLIYLVYGLLYSCYCITNDHSLNVDSQVVKNEPRKQLRIIEKDKLQDLISFLDNNDYIVYGPTIQDGAIIYDEISGLTDLPVGWTDKQDGGTYRLERRDDEACFGYNVGPHSWKKFLHPQRLRLWEASRKDGKINIIPHEENIKKIAFIGVRSCELHAIAIQDKVFNSSHFQDNDYLSRRSNSLFIAVNCAQAGGTCFCDSMQTGPKATTGFDLSLTEIINDGPHRFLVETGSKQGEMLLESINHKEATVNEEMIADKIVANTRQQMGRKMDSNGIKAVLQNNLEHPRWDDVASRCLSCANCTMVCPTCFCTTVEDVTDLTGDHAERWRTWDSCFSGDFSYIHGGNIRHSTKSRYRQWLTHKLANWIDQFDTSGCVGCGRCITWCPVGIDITEEVNAIRSSSIKGDDQ